MLPYLSIAPECSMSYFTTKDNARIYYKDWGSGSTVILIHGWPLTSDSWEDQAIALVNAGHRVIAYDRRGFGRSTQSWHGYDYNTLADDLAALIKHTAVNDVALVGFSMGGGEIARYMSRFDGRSVAKIALISSILPFRLLTPDNPSGTDASAFEQTAQRLKTDRPDFYHEFFHKFFGVSLLSKPVSQAYLDWIQQIAMQGSLRSALQCLNSFSSTDFRADLKSVQVPTLVIHGTEDLTVPIQSSSRLVGQFIRHAELIEYDGAPHGLFATEKDRLSKDLISFLKTTPVLPLL
jgi:non-heme chloroperoxidase